MLTSKKVRNVLLFTLLGIFVLLMAVSVQPAMPETALLAFTSDADLFVVNPISGEGYRITDTPDIFESDVHWSPDGTQLAYVNGTYSWRPTNYRIRYNLNIGEVGIQPLPTEYRTFDNMGTLSVMDLETGEIKVVGCTIQVTHRCSNPIWSPDGMQIAYMHSNEDTDCHTCGEWYVVNIATGEEHMLFTGSIWIDGRGGWWTQDGLFVVQHYSFLEHDYRWRVYNVADANLIAEGPSLDIPSQYRYPSPTHALRLDTDFVTCGQVEFVQCGARIVVLHGPREIFRVQGTGADIFIPQ